MARWLTGWHFSLGCARFGAESPVFLLLLLFVAVVHFFVCFFIFLLLVVVGFFAWLIISLEPNFQLEISQSKWLRQCSPPS